MLDKFITLLVFTPAILATPAIAAPTHDSSVDVQATIRAALDEAQSGDIKTLRDQYAPDCTFIDEFKPFYWSGSNAIDNYLSSAAQMYRETHHGDVKMTVGPASYTYVAGDRAYAVERLAETATVGGKAYKSTGSLTFTLIRSGRGWKINSQVWTKSSENMNPY